MKISLREECNAILIAVIFLSQEINNNLRLIQNLWALNIIDRNQDGTFIIDRFGEEPYDTICRILPQIKSLVNERFWSKDVNLDNLSLRATIISSLEKLDLVSECNGYIKLM